MGIYLLWFNEKCCTCCILFPHVATAVTQSMTGFRGNVALLHLKMSYIYYIEKIKK